jgi:hypothetical protein
MVGTRYSSIWQTSPGIYLAFYLVTWHGLREPAANGGMAEPLKRKIENGVLRILL